MNSFPKDKTAPGDFIGKVMTLFKSALIHSNSASTTASPPNLPRAYLVKAPPAVSINLEAALLVNSTLEFFLNQLKLVQTAKEAEIIDQRCLKPLQISLNGPLVSIFLNSVLAWKRTEPMYKIIPKTHKYY